METGMKKNNEKTKKRVVIVGMGFGGVRAAEGLAGRGFDVLCIDRRNYHLFQPLLYQVATATLNQEAIAHPIRAIIRGKQDVRFEMTEVDQVDLDNKQILTRDERIDYDYLIVAAGSVTNFFGIESVQKRAYDLKQLNDAVALRNHVLSIFERASHESNVGIRRALLSFVIVGAGPTGVEYAGALSELVQVLGKDFPELDTKEVRIVMVEAMDKVLGPFPQQLGEYAKKKLEGMGVEVLLKTAVKAAEADKVILGDGREIPSYTLFWAAGVKASPLAEKIPVEKARGGRIPVNNDWSLKGYPEAFVVGDMAWHETDGKVLPGVAPVAIQGGDYVAKVICARESGRAMWPFKYFDKGSMAVIGRGAAVTSVKGLRMKGVVAWFAWLGLHLVYLAGTRNRVLTTINWMWDYLRLDRQVRLITREANAPKDEEYRLTSHGAPAIQNVSMTHPVNTPINSVN
ncbi:MAG: hypothetical protein JWN98_1916 [Abditibacteriota bacterium]|nr:hypothetical protein [Abditibacteriota bacterium]